MAIDIIFRDLGLGFIPTWLQKAIVLVVLSCPVWMISLLIYLGDSRDEATRQQKTKKKQKYQDNLRKFEQLGKPKQPQLTRLNLRKVFKEE